jgi:hypothetical protein
MAAGSTYEPIATTTVGTATPTVTFSSITGSYTDLVLVINSSITENLSSRINVNNDSETNYSLTYFRGGGVFAASFRSSNVTNISTSIGNLANTRIMEVIQFQNYSNTTTYKTIIVRGGSGTAVVGDVGLWRNTAAINIIVLTAATGNYAVGSTFTLYGIAAA